MWMIDAADRALPKKYTSAGWCLDARLVNELPYVVRFEDKYRVGEEWQPRLM